MCLFYSSVNRHSNTISSFPVILDGSFTVVDKPIQSYEGCKNPRSDYPPIERQIITDVSLFYTSSFQESALLQQFLIQIFKVFCLRFSRNSVRA